MTVGRILRIAAAVAILVSGLIHIDLYFDGYRAIPDIGRGFMLNAIASGVIAVAVAVRREWFVRLAGIGLAASTLIAFFLSRRGDGLFDFREEGLNPSPQAALSLIVEIAAIVLLGLSFVPALAKKDASFGIRALGASVAVAAVALVGYGAIAARDGKSSTSTSETPAGPSAVSIIDFSFKAPALTVIKGTTVTWTNDDGVEHSVVANDDTFKSERLAKGDTFEFTFDADGEFAYICGIHPYMAGTVVVGG